MPNPRKNEKKSAFLTRCIPIVMKEPDTKGTKHAFAKCNGIWNQSKKK